MGNKCLAYCDKHGGVTIEDNEDLPVIPLKTIKDPIEKWEKSYPFYRTPLYKMHETLL